jgi:hypothetical protein
LTASENGEALTRRTQSKNISGAALYAELKAILLFLTVQCSSDKHIPNGIEKEMVIKEYVTCLGKIPCKFFKYGSNEMCPFGNSCFYAHLDE